MDAAGEKSNDYHFITHWRVQGDIDQVAQILSDAPGLARWWPAVYLDVQQLEPGDAHGIGKYVELFTKGWLPYTLRWRFRVTEADHPRGFSIVATGDFEGRGIWTLAQDGLWVDVVYDWKIRAEKPLLRYGSFIVKPIFAANHRWAMAKGEESLRLELARRGAASPEERARIPNPPAPTTLRPLRLAATAVLAVALLRLAVRALIARRR
ncbi:MAG TPA: SRPBCC family protein [Chloroflexota bacterium]